MQVKARNGRTARRHPRHRHSRRRRFALLGVLALIFIASSGFFASEYISRGGLGRTVIAWAHNHGYYQYMNDVSPTRAILQAPLRAVHLALRRHRIPTLIMDVKFKDMEKIRAKRAEALAQDILVTSDDDWVPGTVRVDGRTVRVKLRLKGDWIDHLDHRTKWSFRIHVKGKDQLFGLRRFSIQHPKTRGFQGEPLFFETLRRMGVLAPRYFFVHAIRNGTDMGVMALEEHFSKELLEASQRREGVIIKFEESQFWDGRLIDPFHNPYDNFRTATIDAFGSSRIDKSESLTDQRRIAIGRLRAFAAGDLPASRVFDVERLGRFLAVAEAWGSRHALRWHNQRFYLNPITLKLEPIGFDGNIHDRVHVRRQELDRRLAPDEPMVAAMLADPPVRAAYEKGLRDLHRELVENGLLDHLKAMEQDLLADLGPEFFLLYEYPLDELVTRTRLVLDPASEQPPSLQEHFTASEIPGVASLLHAYTVSGDGASRLELVNCLPWPVTVERLRWAGPGGNDAPLEAGTPLPVILPATPLGEPPAWVRLALPIPPPGNGWRPQLVVACPERAARDTVAALPYDPELTRPLLPEATLGQALAAHPFLVLDSESGQVAVRPGTWDVRGSLVLPAGAPLTVPAGTVLRFAPGEGMVLRGPVQFLGTAEAPIVLEGQAPDTLWQGVAVLEAGGPSVWSHVRVHHTTGVSRPRWTLTGAVNFYRSDITLDHCELEDNRTEDALNVVLSRFTFRDLTIIRTVSDAFDSDFSEGTIEGGLFQDIGLAGGGDAIDVSGTTLTVTGTRFVDIHDKGLSIGEKSHARAERLVMERVETGAASKDGSELDLTDSTIHGATLAGLMAYIKKPEHGPATLHADRVTMEDVDRPTVAQTGSTILLDGAEVPTQELDVNALYRTLMKPGLRR